MNETLGKRLALALVLVLAFMLAGCSNSPDGEPRSRFDIFAFIDFGLTLQDTLVQAYKSDHNLSSELVQDSYHIMESMEKVADKVTTSKELTIEFIDLLAKGHTFNDGYSGTFSLNPAYGTNTPLFTMNTLDLTKIYMLVSSSTRLFIPETTIKTIFHDNSSLDAAWQRSIDHHQSGNMYLNIYEIDADGTVQRTGSAAVIPKTAIANF